MNINEALFFIIVGLIILYFVGELINMLIDRYSIKRFEHFEKWLKDPNSGIKPEI